jgi:hypothetical protein
VCSSCRGNRKGGAAGTNFDKSRRDGKGTEAGTWNAARSVRDPACFASIGRASFYTEWPRSSRLAADAKACVSSRAGTGRPSAAACPDHIGEKSPDPPASALARKGNLMTGRPARGVINRVMRDAQEFVASLLRA